jgi:hypothetical protein
MLRLSWNFDPQLIISPLVTLGSVTATCFVGARAELERRIPKTGITPNGFARHCIPGLRCRIMKKFLFLILGTWQWATAKERLGRNRWRI